MQQHDPLILAYLAGMVDGDGYISIQRGAHKTNFISVHRSEYQELAENHTTSLHHYGVGT